MSESASVRCTRGAAGEKYKVINSVEYEDGFVALTKHIMHIMLSPGKGISYQRHTYRSEIWTIIDGEGEVVLGSERKPVRRGDVIKIDCG